MNAQERETLIRDRKEDTGRKERLWVKDDWKEFKIYRVPVDGLLLNVDNRRFKAERTLMEEKLGHPLDPENSEDDERSVIAILLDTGLEPDGNIVTGQPSKDFDALREDWLKRKQEKPFWIRPDGTVRNGNRRLAMLRRMRETSGIEGTEWADAVILEPVTIDEQEVFELEQREQLTEDFKVRYTDINLLLALRDAAMSRAIDWADPDSIERVAGELRNVGGKGGNKTYAAIQLRAIRYMDEYLKDSNAPGQYHKLVRQVERFRDVGNVMVTMDTDYPESAADMLRLAFAAIRAGNPHGDIRSFRKMFIEDPDRFRQLCADIEKDEEGWVPVTEVQLSAPNLATEPDVEQIDDDESEVPGPVVPNYPGEKVKTRIKNSIDGFLAASTLDVASTLEQVINRLTSLTGEPNRLGDALSNDPDNEVKEKLRCILEWSKDAERFLVE